MVPALDLCSHHRFCRGCKVTKKVQRVGKTLSVSTLLGTPPPPLVCRHTPLCSISCVCLSHTTCHAHTSPYPRSPQGVFGELEGLSGIIFSACWSPAPPLSHGALCLSRWLRSSHPLLPQRKKQFYSWSLYPDSRVRSLSSSSEHLGPRFLPLVSKSLFQFSPTGLVTTQR